VLLPGLEPRIIHSTDRSLHQLCYPESPTFHATVVKRTTDVDMFLSLRFFLLVYQGMGLSEPVPRLETGLHTYLFLGL